MKRVFKKQCWPIAVFLLSTMMITGCDQNGHDTPDVANITTSSKVDDQPITITHGLGTAVITHTPQRVAALDMNEVDLLDQLDVTVAGMPKDFVPAYLSEYKNDPNIVDLGAIVQPNMERVYALKPDLILISPLQAGHYQALSELAPTLSFDVNYQDSGSDHFDIVKNHLLTLGKIFDKDAQAQRVVDSLTAKVKNAQSVIENRPEKAMIVIHNNGAYRFLGEKSRYGFVFEALGVKSIKSPIEAGLHGQPISSEFIYENNPDILYVLDRTAVMERHAGLTSDTMDNPLLRQTNAWKNQRVIFVDSEAWYIAGAGVSSLNIIIDDVLKGFRYD
ncbi:putative ABC transporter solute-binding protein YclQ precursor [Marinomonas gallaica]|uniref:ABC transporter solute-binding protein YclQ n=1 Tax=Marinomonas gallaica TaxID=1806667 RepID=A0A1C3JSK5_9GAMM|nr:siderophore ABC transporter substrate-binding protein [Marinomonas gallaica]SBT18132.1 putative ABC transporter solute-binding protein YclQ precursor [Marinomonas gallaica]SBT22512.1 putative ABC transporter solute-binding protein YclQ precursor [Marinomonas gallaica]